MNLPTIDDPLDPESNFLAPTGGGGGLAATGEGITHGTAVWTVRNLDLACCLLAIGIRLRTDPPYTHLRRADGTEQWTFLFNPATDDGSIRTADMVRAFGEDMKFIQKNPEHPFTIAMCAVKNRKQFLEFMRSSNPIVGYRSRSGKSITYVKFGSRRERNCKAKGMVQI